MSASQAIRVGFEHGELRNTLGRKATVLDQGGLLEGGDAGAVEPHEIGERLGADTGCRS